MKIDRKKTYTVKEALRLIADDKHPVTAEGRRNVIIVDGDKAAKSEGEARNELGWQSAVLRLRALIDAGQIRPRTQLGFPILMRHWQEGRYLSQRSIDSLRLSAEDLQKLCGECDVAIEEPPPAREGELLKRGALIKKYEREWPTIYRDLHDASTNELSERAKATRPGMWHEKAALDWARERGKLVISTPLVGVSPRVHRIR